MSLGLFFLRIWFFCSGLIMLVFDFNCCCIFLCIFKVQFVCICINLVSCIQWITLVFSVLPAINTTFFSYIGFYSNYYFHLPFALYPLFHFNAFYVIMFCLFFILTYSNWRNQNVQDRDLLHRIKLCWIIMFNGWCTCIACRPVCLYGIILDDIGNCSLGASSRTDRSVCRRKTLQYWFEVSGELCRGTENSCFVNRGRVLTLSVVKPQNS
jgi:hypothetical protein